MPLLVAGASHPLPSAIAAVGLIALLDGGLHLDGLADTFDALAAPSGGADRARSDPRAGAAGVVAIVVTLGLAAASIAEVAAGDGVRAAAVVIAAAALSRATAPSGRSRRPSPACRRRARAWFADEVTRGAAAFALLTRPDRPPARGVRRPGVALASLAGPAAAASSGRARPGPRQLDGDGYGAIIELDVRGDRPRRGAARMSRPLVVILGGTRSGKSRFGRDRAAALAGDGP